MLKNELPVDEPIGLLIGAVRRRIKQAVGGRVRRYNLSFQQFWVLVAVAEHPGLSLGELAAHLRMDTPTASRVVFALTNQQRLEVKGDAADRRRARIYLGAGGATLARQLRETATAVRMALLEGISLAEQMVLRASLRTIIANMDRFQNGHATGRSAEVKARRTSAQHQPARRSSLRR
jgi:MarR family transcriptional regulator, transcriptional regulator for hemolysin